MRESTRCHLPRNFSSINTMNRYNTIPKHISLTFFRYWMLKLLYGLYGFFFPAVIKKCLKMGYVGAFWGGKTHEPYIVVFKQRSKTPAEHETYSHAVPVMRWLSCLGPVLWYHHRIHFETSLTSRNWATPVSAIARRLPCAIVSSQQNHQLPPAKDGPLGTAGSQQTSHHSVPWASWETSESSSQSPLKSSQNDRGPAVSLWLLLWCALSSLWTIIS